MQSVRKGLRSQEIIKDTYGRLQCAECGIDLAKRHIEDDIGSIMSCPECNKEWRRVD